MASLGTLGQMMMELGRNRIEPYDPVKVTLDAAKAAGSIIDTKTALLQLQELKRQQAAQDAARQFMQANPGAFLGEQGMPQSTLGSLASAGPGPLTQTTTIPGQPPTSQTVAAAPDLSQFATGMPTSTLGSLGTQANPLEALMRSNPDAAFAVMQRQQQVQDVRTRVQETQLTIGTKVAEYIGRTAQGVRDQASLEAARQEMARISPQAAMQLPQTYSREAMLPFIERAISAKDNAQLRLETWKTQAEMARLGLQGEPAAMVSELRAMGVNPLSATPEQRRQAQQNIQARELEQKQQEGYAGKMADIQAQKEARQGTTLAEAFKGDTTNLYDTQTGQPLDARMKVHEYEALPQGRARMLSNDTRKSMEQLNSAVPIISQLQTHIDKIYGPGGVFARMTPEDLRIVNTIDPSKAGNLWDQMTKKYPELVQAQRFIDANASALARALAGETGAMNEGDIERAKAMLPNLKTALNVWPPSKIGVQLPDTRATALGTMNSLVDMINARGQTLLGNEQYAHPKLHRYQTAAEAQQQTGTPGPTTTPPRPQDMAPEGTPAVGLNPNWRAPGTPAPVPPAPTPGAFGAPEQKRYVPETPSPGRQSQAPQPPTATSTPAAGPTRVARASGPKVMNLADVAEAMRQTGKSRAAIEARARELGYTVYGSKLPLPTALA